MTHTLSDSLADNYVFLGHPNLAEHVARTEEIRAAYQRIAELTASLVEARAYIDVDSSIIDGKPNRAMRLVGEIDETLHGPGF